MTSSPFDPIAYYDDYPRIEEEFTAFLNESLQPRGPEQLYDILGGLGLPSGASVLDVGCGEGGHALKLASRFGFDVHGVDPLPRHVDLSNVELTAAAEEHPELSQRVRFSVGGAEELPVGDASVDLVWCRDVLVHVPNLDQAYAEFRRVLRDSGRVLVYQMFATERLEAAEAGWLLGTTGVVPTSADPARTEAAIAAAGLRVDSCLELGTEWGEYAEETSGHTGRKLLHTARLLRQPERYTSKYGRAAYDIMLSDCLWHVYRMLGKLSPRVYVLSAG